MALGLKDCTFNSQTREIDASSLSAGEEVAVVEEEAGDEILGGPCDLMELEEGTV